MFNCNTPSPHVKLFKLVNMWAELKSLIPLYIPAYSISQSLEMKKALCDHNLFLNIPNHSNQSGICLNPASIGAKLLTVNHQFISTVV